MDTGLLPLLRTDPTAFILLVAALIGAIGLHEYAHALAADLQGDRMPRAMGRLTPNPIKHLDPLGSLFIVLVGFGWGKPVEFRPQALSSKRFGAAADREQVRQALRDRLVIDAEASDGALYA